MVKSIVKLIRHAVSFVALPCTVAAFIPMWLARRNAVAFDAPDTTAGVLAVAAGLVLAIIGSTLFAASLFHFWSSGDGTLAPWNPPRRFVVNGPYRYVRNPMISGVLFVLVAEACLLRSPVHAAWAATFGAMNALYIPLVEEPMLAARFGEPYERYKRSVRRFVPRLRRWDAQERASPTVRG